MGLITIAPEDWANALEAIETGRPESIVTYVGRPPHVEPDLTRPYTVYDEQTLSIEADGFIAQMLDEAGISYNETL